MLILAIDSATPTASVALAQEGTILYENFVNYKKTHSETLMPMVEQTLLTCEKELADCTALAVTIGPGSFTGLRIGLAAAKAISLATGIPIVGISTLELLAQNVNGLAKMLVAPLLDARKHEVYCGFYQCGTDTPLPQALSAETACSPEDFVAQAKQWMAQTQQSQLVLLGDGFAPYADYFRAELGSACILPPAPGQRPRAAVLAELARLHLQKNPQGFLDSRTAKPVYLRLSEAEYRLGKGEL